MALLEPQPLFRLKTRKFEMSFGPSFGRMVVFIGILILIGTGVVPVQRLRFPVVVEKLFTRISLNR